METRTPMQRIIDAQNYSRNHNVQLRHALNDPYTSMRRQEERTGPQADSARDYDVIYSRERAKMQEQLRAEYTAEISAWDWTAAKSECMANVDDEADSGTGMIIGRCYIGSVLNTYPSGKIYAAWTTNQTDYDVMRDEVFAEVLDDIASMHGGWIDGDSGDLFFCIGLDAPDSDDSEEQS